MSQYNQRPTPKTLPARDAEAPRAPQPDVTRGRWPHDGVLLEEATRVRAYQLWERAGRPGGDGVAFWLEAEKELAEDRSGHTHVPDLSIR